MRIGQRERMERREVSSVVARRCPLAHHPPRESSIDRRGVKHSRGYSDVTLRVFPEREKDLISSGRMLERRELNRSSDRGRETSQSVGAV